jgi:hypothetical protein
LSYGGVHGCAGQASTSEFRADALARKAAAEGQILDDGGFGTWCLICNRATDHGGEHSPEQSDAWRARRGYWPRPTRHGAATSW